MRIMQLINRTDLSFFQYCEQKYGINRGVFNTIEALLYDRGFIQILSRRQTILSFLEFVIQSGPKQSNRYKFGPGGLSSKIKEFWLERMEDIEKESIY